MAISAGNTATGASKTTGATIATSTTISANRDDLILVVSAWLGATVPNSCSDGTSNVYTSWASGANGTSVAVAGFYTTVVNALSSATITVSGVSTSARAIAVVVFTGWANRPVVDVVTPGNNTGTATSAPCMTSLTPSHIDGVYGGAVAWNAPTGDTYGGNMSGPQTTVATLHLGTSGGSAASNVTALLVYGLNGANTNAITLNGTDATSRVFSSGGASFWDSPRQWLPVEPMVTLFAPTRASTY